VWGSNSSEERKASIKRLIRGDHEALIASVIFNEGVDIPELRSVVIASGGKSTIAALQRIGRGMRVKKDATGNVVKDEFEVYDFQDEGDRWLQRHTRARVAAYMREGFETIVEGGAQLVLPATRESSSA
jgi:superfamily II DNA or RNA helicase